MFRLDNEIELRQIREGELCKQFEIGKALNEKGKVVQKFGINKLILLMLVSRIKPLVIPNNITLKASSIGGRNVIVKELPSKVHICRCRGKIRIIDAT